MTVVVLQANISQPQRNNNDKKERKKHLYNL